MPIPTLDCRSTPAYGDHAVDAATRGWLRRRGGLVLFIIIIWCGMALTMGGVGAEEQVLSDTAVLNKVFEYCAQREFQRAAVLLEEARRRSHNEEILLEAERDLR